MHSIGDVAANICRTSMFGMECAADDVETWDYEAVFINGTEQLELCCCAVKKLLTITVLHYLALFYLTDNLYVYVLKQFKILFDNTWLIFRKLFHA